MGKKGYLYFISDCAEHIKIGVTDSINRRIKQLQTGNAQELYLVHYVVLNSPRDAYELEALLHRSMEKHKVKNEWYRKRPVMKMLRHNWIHVGNYRFRGLGYPIWKIAGYIIAVSVMLIFLYFT